AHNATIPLTHWWLFVLKPIFHYQVISKCVNNSNVNLSSSECGTYDPQSCIFSQVCNICAVLILWVVVIRFQQVRDYGLNSKVNIASIVLGFISSLGISILGSFRQSVLFGIHVFGAFLAFFVGLGYFWLQVWLTYKVQPSKDRRWMGPLRAALCSICTILIITMAIGLLFDTGYRSMASISEWALAMCFFVLFGLFASEFRHIDCHRLTVQNQGLKQDPEHQRWWDHNVQPTEQ
uniref:Transmembrane protein 150B n=1 Tax=Salmo trutta TaxID=8032 RepID=A0A673YLI6_SALTR